MKAPRAKGNATEDAVISAFDGLGRYAVPLRGSGSRGSTQQLRVHDVVADVIVLPHAQLPGIVVECGGAGKATRKAFGALTAPAGYARAVVLRLPKKRWRWLLADNDGGYTECEDAADLHATVCDRLR